MEFQSAHPEKTDITIFRKIYVADILAQGLVGEWNDCSTKSATDFLQKDMQKPTRLLPRKLCYFWDQAYFYRKRAADTGSHDHVA